MDGAMNTPDVAYLLSVAAGAIVMLLVLIMRFKVHAFVALTLDSMLTALATGVTYDQVIPTMLTGFGGTLAEHNGLKAQHHAQQPQGRQLVPAGFTGLLLD